MIASSLEYGVFTDIVAGTHRPYRIESLHPTSLFNVSPSIHIKQQVQLIGTRTDWVNAIGAKRVASINPILIGWAIELSLLSND